jgi:hypothetical protein
MQRIKLGELAMRYITIICSIIVGAAVLPSPVFAQQKTEKACQAEWRANKADNQAKKITEKAYVAQCRSAGAATAAPAAAPAAAPKKTTAPAPAAAAPKSAPASAATVAKPATAAPTGANQFSTEAQAKARCPADTVVWVNKSSKIYHFAGTKDYGNTKSGAYMCEKDTAGAGARAAKNEKHP